MKSNWKYFVLPIYWPVWLLFFVLWLLVQLPFAWQLKMGRGLGLLIRRFSKKSEHTARVNLKLCFPEKSEAEREALLKENFANAGIAIFETGMGFWASDRRLKGLVDVKNGQVINRLLAEGEGVLLLGAHFTTLEIVGRACCQEYPFSVMYRPHKLRILNFFVERNMKKHYENAIPRYNMLRMVKTLKNKRAVWYSTDVNAGRKHSVFAPFFGVQAATTKAPVRLTKLTGCKVLTLKHFRRKDGKGYVAEVSDPLDNFPSGDAQADAARINAITEAAIRECPEQYLWQYKRFKTRPNKSDKKFY